MNVMRAALRWNVKRVVMTSTIGAIIGKGGKEDFVYSNKDWTDDPDFGNAYI